MICFFCHRPVRGADVVHRCEWRYQPGAGEDGQAGRTVRIYGDGAPDGKLKDAKGQLARLSHGKCYHAFKKQEELRAARAADPSSHPRQETDWRDQTVLDVEELTPDHEGNRAN